MNALIDGFARIAAGRNFLGIGYGTGCLAIFLARDRRHHNTVMALPVVWPELMHNIMRERHFHNAVLPLEHITAGKGQVQMLLAEVNAGYLLHVRGVPFRETGTQNWHFFKFMVKRRIK